MRFFDGAVCGRKIFNFPLREGGPGSAEGVRLNQPVASPISRFSRDGCREMVSRAVGAVMARAFSPFDILSFLRMLE
jgi:hypothetical protein